MKIRVATGDAATTAIAYGAITQAVNLLFPVLESIKNFSLPKTCDIDIVADFAGEGIEADIEISFALRVWHLFHVAFGALFSAIGHFVKKMFRTQQKQQKKPSPPAGHKLPSKK